MKTPSLAPLSRSTAGSSRTIAGWLCSGLIATVLALSAAAPAQAQLQETRLLFVNNACKYPVRLLVHHKDSHNDHHPHGWYQFGAFESNQLQANDVVLRHIVGEALYLYAETLTSGGAPLVTWAGKDATTAFGGVYYSLRKVTATVNPRGQLEVRLACSE